MTDIEKLKKRILEIPDIPLGSDSFVLGTRAQQYDVGAGNFSLRNKLRFPVHTARVTETARASSGRPTVQEFKESRIPQWFIGKKPKEVYLGRMDKYIETGQEWNIVSVDAANTLQPGWAFEVDVLKRSGTYLKEIYSENWLELKSPQMQSLILSREILEQLPSLKDLDLDLLGMTNAELTQRLSELQTMGAVKVLDSGLIIPSIATEVHGDQVEKVLSSTLTDPVDRYVFELIRKMPGIRFSKLLKHIGVPAGDEHARNRVFKSFIDLKTNGLIMMFLNDFGDDAHIVPVWICHSLFFASKPTVIDAHTLRQCFVVCSGFWDKVEDISTIDKQVDTLRGILDELMRKNSYTSKELDELAPIYRIFISNMTLIGAVRRDINGVTVEEDSRNVLNATLFILNSIYRAEAPSYKKVEKIDSNFLKELNSTSEEVFRVIGDRLSIGDVKSYTGLEK